MHAKISTVSNMERGPWVETIAPSSIAAGTVDGFDMSCQKDVWRPQWVPR